MALTFRNLMFSVVAAMTTMPGQAQTVRGTVVAAAGATPVAHASIVARRRGTATTTEPTADTR